MAPVTTELKVLVKAVGKGELKELEAALNKLAVTAKTKVDTNFKKVSLELKKVQRTSAQSISNLRGYRNAWRDIAEQVDVTSREFQVATRNAEKLDAQLKKIQQTSRTRISGGARLRAGAQVAGTVAGAGIFGGIEGALGAGAGALIGGPAGAIVGGAIGAQVGGIRQAVGSVAEYGAELNKLRIALRGVTESQQDYDQVLGAITQATKDFAIPQSVLTRQFTRLQASVQGAGGNIRDTETAFRGIVAAVRATGGSLADVDAALTATAQVFSKGKVSAEELRQQIGERLPGAFTLFAEAIGKTPQELDKALEDGQVSLQDFQAFAEAIFERYGETAQIIADGPEAAGDRLKVVLENLQEDIAPELSNLGAQFQNFATEAIKAISSVFQFLGDLGRAVEEKIDGKLIDQQRKALADAQRALIRTDLTAFQQEFNRQQIERLQPIIDAYDFIGPLAPSPSDLPGVDREPPKPRARGGRAGGGRTRAPMSQFEFELRQRINDAREQELDYAQRIAEFDLKIFEINTKLVNDPLKQLDEFRKAEIKLNEQLLKIDESKVKSAEKYEQSIVDAGKSMGENLAKMIPETNKLKDLWKSIGDSISTGVAGAIEGAIFEAKSLQESLSGILRSVASLLIQFGTKSLFSSIGFANGGIMTGQGPLDLKTYARGGIARSPQLAMFGEGSMPEAYVPLPDGRSIPVTMRGGGAGNIVVNVDAKGTQVEGDQGRSKQLGTAISAAVQAELIKQQRPGGLLNR